MTEPYVPAPTGAPVVVVMDTLEARQVAYYTGSVGPTAYAPRRWYCTVSTGTAGGEIVVTPTPYDSTKPWSRVLGPALRIQFFNGGTSGRFDVALYSSRLFPRVAAAFIKHVKRSGILAPDDSTTFDRGPYSTDSVTYLDSTVAEFVAPPGTDGLGSEAGFPSSQDPIRGVALLCPRGEWGLTILWIRLPPDQRQLETALLKLNEQRMRARRCY